VSAVADALRAASPARAGLAGRRVLMIVENLPAPFDRRVWQEARTLKSQGVEVAIVCPQAPGYEAAREEIDGISIWRHPLPAEGHGALGYLREYSAALWRETALAWRVFLAGPFDALHICNPPDLIFLVALPFKLFGVKIVFDHHDICPELYEAKFGRRDLFWRLLRLAERLTYAVADVALSTNESYRALALSRGGKAREDVFVVRSGPDLDALRPVPPNPRWRCGKRHLIGYVGVMGEQEGLDLLLQAMAHLVFNLGRTDVFLALAGAGTSLPALKAMAGDLGLDGHVEFLGRVSNADLCELLSSADVCVNPDRVNAMNDLSTMNKIMEYMAFAKPIVQFEVREGRVSAGDASLYARANDVKDFARAITELLDDPARCARMGAIGRERVETKLCWRAQAPALLAAYERALNVG
jgi:glycosyltransferase involved in cell wall biosynthesis